MGISESDKRQLAADLLTFFNTCVSHRQSVCITSRFEEARLQAKSQYDEATRMKIEKKKEPNLFLPLTSLKLRAQVAWIRDTMQNSRDKMWELESDAIPELSNESKLEAARQLGKEFQEALDAGMTFDEFDAAAEKIVNAEAAILRKQAESHIEPMTDLIRDQLHEGGFQAAFDEALVDLYTHVGVLKAPVIEHEERLVYGKGPKPTVKDEIIPKIKRVDPVNFFPAPDVGSDTNAGTGVFEKVSWTKTALVQAMELDGYDADEIKALLRKNPDGYNLDLGGDRDIRPDG